MPTIKQFCPSFFGVSLIFLFLNCQQSASQLAVSPIFADQMVIQQNTQSAFWGTAAPATEISINGSWGANEKTVTDQAGAWQVKLPTPSAGGPFEITISANDTTITLKEVLAGEVWLCSGQSNMEMPLKGWPPNDPIDNAVEEIANANYPMIRMFTVQKAIDITPTKEYAGKWAICNPTNAADFSATAYFFGRALHQKLKVPIGLIHTSWGGTLAEAWTEGKHLSSLSDFENVLTQLEQAKPQQAALNEWLSSKEVIDNTELPADTRWNNLDFKDEGLVTGKLLENTLTDIALPTQWEQAKVGLDAFDGTMLFRKEVMIPNEMLNQELILELGPIDDMDVTYFNGIEVGRMMGAGHWNTNRVYTIPKSLTSKNKNLLSIRVVDTGGGGGFGGNAESMKIYVKGNEEQSINLGGNGWNYLPIAEYRKGKFYHYGGTIADFQTRPKVDIDLNANSPTVLYNAMIAPLVPYTIKGAIWYQGESNAQRAKQYETLFPKMIESWRTVWGQGDFPFYFTQIAPFNYGDSNAMQSAQLRDAQRKSMSVPNTGMAVTLDIGNVDNIHPGNKQDVGKRLALWALAKDYGQSSVVPTGPLYTGMEVEDDAIRVMFSATETGLVTQGTTLEGFEIAGANGEFLPAKATIDGTSVLVSHAAITTPTQVRYAFKNGSSASLFNGAGLPASSFSSAD